MHLDIFNNYKKLYTTESNKGTKEEKPNFSLSGFLSSLNLNFTQISLICLTFAIIYFIDKLNMINMMGGVASPSPIPGFSSLSSLVQQQKRKKK